MFVLKTHTNQYRKSIGRFTRTRLSSQVDIKLTDDINEAYTYPTLEDAVQDAAELTEHGFTVNGESTFVYLYPVAFTPKTRGTDKPDLRVVKPAKKQSYRDKFESMKMPELRAWCKARMSPETIRGWGEGSLRKKETYIRAAWLWVNTHARQAEPTHMIAAA